jgi:hypothetical protein
MDEEMTLTKLHANRAALREAWLTRVEEARAAGLDQTRLNAVGPILTRNNELMMFVSLDGRRTYDLRIDAAGEITEDRAPLPGDRLARLVTGDPTATAASVEAAATAAIAEALD